MNRTNTTYNNYSYSGNTCAGAYRYGFNGKENDAETGTQDYGMRIYNPSLGKFLSVDPLSRQYAMLTPYQFASNCPIWLVDIDGLEGGILTLPRFMPRLTIPRITLPELPMPPSLPMPPIIAPIPNAPAIPRVETLPIAPQVPVKPIEMTTGDIDWSTPPNGPEDLSDDWDEVTHPDNKGGGREFQNKNSGEKIRFDKGRPGEPGWEGKDHWHRHNPLWDKPDGKKGYYLDRFGNPVNKGAGPSHIPAGGNIYIGPQIDVWPGSDIQWQDYYDKMEDYNDKMEDYKQEKKEYDQEMKEYYENCDCLA